MLLTNTKSVLLLLLVCAYVRVQAQHFTIVAQANFSALGNSSSAWADFDQDGDLDIFISGTDQLGAKRSMLYRNNGDSTFTDLLLPFTPVSNGYCAWGDYDLDGDEDLLVTGSTFNNTRVTILYQNSGGTFSEVVTGIPGVINSTCSFVDYDNDGDLDIFISGTDQNNTIISKIYRNTNGSFTPIQQNISPVTNCSAAWGDYNKDGYIDLILTGTDATNHKTCKIYKNNKAGVLSDIAAVGLSGVTFGSVAWADFDNDGDLDFAISGTDHTNNRIAKIYRYLGGNSFTAISAPMTAVATSALVWGDFDNDGDLDLLSGGYSGTAPVNKLYRNDGGSFVDSGLGFFGSYSSTITVADFDGDNDLDIFVSGFGISGPVSTLYRNSSIASNTAPTIPANTSEVILEDTARLSWGASSDAETVSAALTYNIFVSTSKTAVTTKSAAAHIHNGFKTIAMYGNTGLNNHFELRGLEQGKYYWSVQAVDNSLVGSAFAPLDSFVICRKFSIGNDTAICFKDSLPLTAGVAGDVVNWYSTNTPVIASNQLSIKPEITADDTIWVQRSNAVSGCLTYDTIVVKVNPVSIINAGTDTSICDRTAIRLGGTPTATGSILPYTYRWTPGELVDDSTLANPVAFIYSDTTFRLIVQAGTCKADTAYLRLSLYPLPLVTAVRDTFIGAGETTPLSASGAATYQWSPTTGLDNAQVYNPQASPMEDVEYIVTGTDGNGCKHSDTVNVFVKNDLFIPDLFSPDGNGINETFKLFGAGIMEVDFKVYNRYGEVLYESSDLDELLRKGWDGSYKGIPQPTGTYLWTMSGKTYEGRELTYRGKKSGTLVLKR